MTNLLEARPGERPGRPVDRIGRPYTEIMLPSYRLGKAPPNKGRRFPPEVLTDAEVLRLLDAIGAQANTWLQLDCAERNRAATVVMWRAGLRIAECVALEPRDVDLEVGSVTVRSGKGGRRRVVGLDPWACAQVASWVERRDERMGDEAWAGPLFPTLMRGYGWAPIQPQYLREVLKQAGVVARIAKPVRPHGLRHTYADNRQRAGWPVTLIQAAMGHSELATTARYLFHLRPHELIDRSRLIPAPGHEIHRASAKQVGPAGLLV